jgi:hemoglobin
MEEQMATIPAQMPEGFEAYGRSPDFTPETLPARLQSAHTTKAGTWAMLHVIEGEVLYRLEPPHYGEQRAKAGEAIVIEAEVAHRVAFTAPGRIFVEFYRKKDSGTP